MIVEADNKASNRPVAAKKAGSAVKKRAAQKKPAKRRMKPASKRRITNAQMIEVLDRMIEGESLKVICDDPKMPSVGTILAYVAGRRLTDDPKVREFGEAYYKAMEIRAWTLGEDIIHLVEHVENNREAIAKARLQLDAKKWIMCKLIPEFSDKQRVELTGAGGGVIKSEVEQVRVYVPDNSRDNT